MSRLDLVSVVLLCFVDLSFRFFLFCCDNAAANLGNNSGNSGDSTESATMVI